MGNAGAGRRGVLVYGEVMMETPMITYWLGVPLNEVPRDELEAALTDTCLELERTRAAALKASVGEIRALADRARASIPRSFLSRFLG